MVGGRFATLQKFMVRRLLSGFFKLILVLRSFIFIFFRVAQAVDRQTE